jgi:hypothetical protein
MATAQTPKTVEPAAAPKAKRTPASMVDRMKAQLSAAAFKAKITADELTVLETHVAKLKSLLS